MNPSSEAKNKTLVLGASTNPNRYAYKAIHRLREHNIPVVGLGLKTGKVADVELNNYPEPFEGIDTITMYLGEPRQVQYYNYLLSLKPRRIIFNPGAENPELAKLAMKHGIEVENACTLVLLSIDQY